MPDEALHADALGITPERHRLVHELLHHLVGFAFGYNGSPVIYRDSRGLAQIAQTRSSACPPLPEEQDYLTAEIEEWIVTAYTYALYGKPHDAGAMMDVQRLCGGVASERLLRHARHGVQAANIACGGLNAKMVMNEWPSVSIYARLSRADAS